MKALNRAWRRHVVILQIILLLMVTRCQTQQQKQSGSESDCKGDTVELLGPETAKQSRAFLSKLKAAVGANRHEEVASLVHYPLKDFIKDKKVTIRSRSEFLHSYDKVMASHVRKVLAAQSEACLFGNWQGFMVGDGEIWFGETSKNVFRIITINTNAVSP